MIRTNLSFKLSKLFDRPWKDRFTVELPNEEQRRDYFEKIKNRCLEPEVNFAAEAESILRPIDFEIDETGNQKMSKDQNNQLEQKEEATMRTLRIFLRSRDIYIKRISIYMYTYRYILYIRK